MLFHFKHIGAAVTLFGVSRFLQDQLAAQLLASPEEAASGGQEGDHAAPVVRLIENPALTAKRVRGRRLGWSRSSGVFVVHRGGGRLQLRPGLCVDVEVPPGLSREDEQGTSLPLLCAALFRALGEFGFSVLHAGAFEVGGRGFVVAGESGAGKSTLAMMALRSGGTVVSDDSLLAGVLPGGGAGVAALRRDAVLREAGERLVPDTFGDRLYRARFSGVERTVLARSRAPSAFAAVSRPERLFVSRVDRRRRTTHLEHASAADGLAALIAASSPVFLTPELGGLRARLLPALVQIAGACAVYRVSLGRDVLTAPDAVAARLFGVGDA